MSESYGYNRTYTPPGYSAPQDRKEKEETVEEIKDEYPYLVNPSRRVRPEIYKLLRFKMKLDPKDGVTPVAAYYPITENGKIVRYKKRDYTKPKEFAFSMVGEGSTVKCEMINTANLKEGRKVFITEGEEDLAACFQAMYDNIQANPQWRSKIWPNVVSVVGGAAHAAENIAHNLETLKRYKEIVTVFDSDKTSPSEYEKGVRRGYEATSDTHLLIGFDKCKYIPLQYKDPSEYLQKGKQEDLAKQLAFGAEDFTPVTIETGDHYSLDEILAPNKKGAPIKCIPNTSGILHGLREHEATLLLAPPKSGKTSLTKQIAYDIMTEEGLPEGEKVGNIYLEETGVKTRQSYIALDCGVSLPKLREGLVEIDRVKALQSYKKLFKSGRNLFLNTRSGKLNVEEVMSNIRYMYAMGCKKIIFDHLSMVVSGSTNQNERKEIDNLLTEIAAFCEANPVHILVIAHVKRTDFKPKVDDDGDIIYPYFHPVSPEDARGSAAFSQLMWNCICIEPEIVDESGAIGRVRTKVAFCREWGTRGIGDYLKWNQDLGRLETVNSGLPEGMENE